MFVLTEKPRGQQNPYNRRKYKTNTKMLYLLCNERFRVKKVAHSIPSGNRQLRVASGKGNIALASIEKAQP